MDDPTLKAPMLGEQIAKMGIALELSTMEQTPMSSETTTQSTTNATPKLETVTSDNWPGHAVDRLRGIEEQLKKANTIGTTAKNAAVGVAVGATAYLVGRGLWAGAARLFGGKDKAISVT